MTSTSLHNLLTQILSSARLDDASFLNVRRAIYHDGKVSLEEADMLFRVNDTIADKPDQWDMFFVGAMTDFLIRQTVPNGYVDAANAAWLMERIDHDGVVESETEFSLLMNVLKKAISVPERLELYVLKQVQESVALGRGFLAEGAAPGNLTLTKRHVDVVRDVIYACGGNGGFGVTKAEAEFLFELNDATEHSDNHDSWPVLFVGGVANHIMMLAAPSPLSHEDAKRSEEFLRRPGRSIDWVNWGGWVRKSEGLSFSIPGALKNLRNALYDDYALQSYIDNSEGMIAAERIDPIEARWLIERLNRDGVISANEVTLLQFIKEECGDIHQSLQSLVDRAA